MTRRSIGLTRRGWTVAGAAVGLLVGGPLLGAEQLTMLGLAAIALTAGSALLVGMQRPQVDVRRWMTPARVHVDDSARVDVVLRARRAVPPLDVVDGIDRGRLRARFRLAALRSGEEVVSAYRLPTDRRGPVVLGPMTAVVTDPFGLAQRPLEIAAAQTVLVRPRVHAIAPPVAGAGRRPAADEAESTRAPAADAGGDFLAVRPYEIGDDPRRVHWRSSARADDLMVRQYAAPRRGHTVMVLDTRSGATDASTTPAFERAVEAVASIASSLARAGRPLECITTGGTVLATRGLDLQRVFDRLATVMADEPDHLDALARARRSLAPDLLIIVTANADARIAAGGATLARRTPALLVVTGGEPTASRLGARPAGTVIDARHVDFPDAWRARHPSHGRGPRTLRPPSLSVVR